MIRFPGKFIRKASRKRRMMCMTENYATVNSAGWTYLVLNQGISIHSLCISQLYLDTGKLCSFCTLIR